MIYKTMIHNVNAITKYADLDYVGDESTYAFGGYGEKGSGLINSNMNKPNVPSGGQIVIITDVERFRPRAYLHRHKFQEKMDEAGWPQGPNEVRLILNKLKPMIKNNSRMGGEKQIYRSEPHGTWDNYFSGDNIMDYAGKKGFGLTMTCRRDRLPKDIPSEYLHKKKTTHEGRPRASIFLNPIVAVKDCTGNMFTDKPYRKVHVSFQSTSSCNISHVNALSSCSGYIRKKERGRGQNKRKWAIEMNHSRELYLRTYHKIDGLDHMIKNCNMFYRSFKYWHAAMIHAKAMAISVAYDIYIECTEGNLDTSWKIDNKKVMSFYDFREKLSTQMLQYDPRNMIYLGDAFMRKCTKQSTNTRTTYNERNSKQSVVDMESIASPRKKRYSTDKQSSVESDTNSITSDNVSSTRITLDHFSKAKDNIMINGRSHPPRLCGDLENFNKHMNSDKTDNNSRLCVVCNKKTYTICTICKVPLHYFPYRGENKGKDCVVKYHCDTFFGLSKTEAQLLGQKKRIGNHPQRYKLEAIKHT